jgi:hypothetical protein
MTKPAPVIQFTPADELLRGSPPEPTWTWQGALVRGAVTLFAGKPKVGKSTLLYALVEAIANGEREFLGRALCGGPVVYASEESRATLGSTFPRHGDIHLLTREGAWPKPAWRDLVAAAAEKTHAVKAVLAVSTRS